MEISKEIFKRHQAQTFPYPSCLEIKNAKGSYITDVHGKKYLDFTAGVSANTLGHSHPDIINAIKKQLEKQVFYGPKINFQILGRGPRFRKDKDPSHSRISENSLN